MPNFCWDLYWTIKYVLEDREPCVYVGGRWAVVLAWLDGPILKVVRSDGVLLMADLERKEIIKFNPWARKHLSVILRALHDHAGFPELRLRGGRLVPANKRKGKPIRDKLWRRLFDDSVAKGRKEVLDFLESFFNARIFELDWTSWEETIYKYGFFCEPTAWIRRHNGIEIRDRGYEPVAKIPIMTIERPENAPWEGEIIKDLHGEDEVAKKVDEICGSNFRTYAALWRFSGRLQDVWCVANGNAIFFASGLLNPEHKWAFLVPEADEDRRLVKLMICEEEWARPRRIILLGRDASTGELWSAAVPPSYWLARLETCRRWVMGIRPDDVIIEEV